LIYLFGKVPQEISADLNLVQFSLSTAKFGLNKNLTGDIYYLIYEGEEYLLAENFFDDFQTMKAMLEK